MARTSGGSSRAGAWVLALVALATLSLVAGAVYYWMMGAGMAPVPAALAPPPTQAPRPAAPVPAHDPRASAAELVALAPEITPAAALLLVREVPNASGPGLADFALVVATRGFEQMERVDLDEMSALIARSYATLPPADQAWMGDYMRMLRDGTLSPDDGLRGRRLLTQAVRALPPAERERLQGLMETAIRAGLDSRRQAVARSQALVAPPADAPPAAPARTAESFPPRVQPATRTPALTDFTNVSPGKDEAYWRGRMTAARTRVTQLKAEIEKLDKEAAREMYGPGEAPACATPQENSAAAEAALQNCLKTRQNWHLAWQAKQKDRLDGLARKRVELVAAERAIGDLEDEGRREGALPGWFRE